MVTELWLESIVKTWPCIQLGAASCRAPEIKRPRKAVPMMVRIALPQVMQILIPSLWASDKKWFDQKVRMPLFLAELQWVDAPLLQFVFSVGTDKSPRVKAW
jgi:hypothetical protein